MDTELKLERLRQENERLRKDNDQVLEERNRYLIQIQEERTRNVEMSNRLLTLESENSDLKRSNGGLSVERNLFKAPARMDAPKTPPVTPAKRKAVHDTVIVISDEEVSRPGRAVKKEPATMFISKDPITASCCQKPVARKTTLTLSFSDVEEISTPKARKKNRQSSNNDIRVVGKPKLIADIQSYKSISDLYLAEVPHFTVSPIPREEFVISREQVNTSFGGQLMTFISTLDRSSSLNGRPIQCVWPENELNPLVVNRVGAPGLMFASRFEILEDPPWYVFSKRTVGGKARWAYCGCYESQRVGHISADHFSGFPYKVKYSWGELIAKSRDKYQPVYVEMRVRIGLRKLGKTVSPERVDQEAEVIFKSKKDSGTGIQVTPEDIICALSAGDEHIDILQMRCVGYDHAFADDLALDIAKRASGPPQAKKAKKTKKKKPRLVRRSPSRETSSSLDIQGSRSKQSRRVLRGAYDEDEDEN